MYFKDLVTVASNLPQIPPADYERVKGQLLEFACGSLLRMDTMAAAEGYMRAVKSKKGSCPSILCRAEGELVTSRGEMSNNSTFKAYCTWQGVRHYFDSLPKESRPECQDLQRVIVKLQAVPQLVTDYQTAQVRFFYPPLVLMALCEGACVHSQDVLASS